jgi:hypothetical protein
MTGLKPVVGAPGPQIGLLDEILGVIDGAARRIFAYALMIRGGIPTARSSPTCTSAPGSLDVPFPRAWPGPAPQRS